MRTRNKNRGFSLIEIMLVMGIILILVAATTVLASRGIRAANETTAAQNVSTLANNEAAFQHSWQGYSPAGTNLGGGENSSTVAATFAADQEVPTVESNQLDAGYVQSGYTILYKPGAVTFKDSAGNTVSTSFEFTAIPISVSSGTKAECSDPSGVWHNELGVGATPATGAGCKTDGYTEQ